MAYFRVDVEILVSTSQKTKTFFRRFAMKKRGYTETFLAEQSEPPTH